MFSSKIFKFTSSSFERTCRIGLLAILPAHLLGYTSQHMTMSKVKPNLVSKDLRFKESFENTAHIASFALAPAWLIRTIHHRQPCEAIHLRRPDQYDRFGHNKVQHSPIHTQK